MSFGSGQIQETELPSEPVKVSIDHQSKLITIRLIGSEPSSVYTEKMLEAYDSVTEPWLYNRLLDYRQFNGIIEAPDVERLAEHWRGLTAGQSYSGKIAVLTADPLTAVRANAFKHLFPTDEIRAFDILHKALDWLSIA